MKRGASDDSYGANKRPAYSNKPSRSPSSSSSEDEDEGHLYARIGDVLHSRYEVISVLGKGDHSLTYSLTYSLTHSLTHKVFPFMN